MARLSPAHLEQIREGLAAGRRPRVVFTDSAGQMAGQVGQVVALTDPATSDEWVVVRFGHDELPFSPVDLELPSRGAKRAATGRPGNGDRPGNGEPSRAGNGATPSRTSANRTTPNRTTPGGTTANGRAVNATVRLTTAANGAAAKSTKDSTAGGPSPARAAPAPDSAAPTARDPRPARPRPARPRPAKQPASLAVTVAYAEGMWTVAASQGNRTISRPQPIRAAEALRLVAMLDAPAVHDAVEHIIAAEQATAEQRAQRLRTELAEIEARLAELRDAR